MSILSILGYARVLILSFTRLSVLVLVSLGVVSCDQTAISQTASGQTAISQTAKGSSGSHLTTRQQLIGAWRLLDIHVTGPKGSTTDPFYNSGSTGLLIYDASGWMSVQIVGQPRTSVSVPASRPTLSGGADEDRLKARVLDSYYAYFGTWTYDEPTSTVTHLIDSSLFPSETGVSYSQTATVEGDELVFTVHREAAGVASVQQKVWKRVPGYSSH
jgi:hypothetical protein